MGVKKRKREKGAKRRKAYDTSSMSARQIQNIVEALELHKAELEIQNEELLRIQEELELSRDKYEDIYDFAPIGLFMISKKGLILEANHSICSKLGLARKGLIGKPLTDYINSEDQDIFYLHRQKLLKGKERQSCELRLKKAKGGNFWAAISCSVTLDDKGEVEGFRVSITDISELKKAEIELKTERDLSKHYFETANVIMIVLGRDGNIGEINSKGCEILGYSSDELVGKNWFKDGLLKKKDLPEVRKVFQNIISGRLERIEYYVNPVVRKDGTERVIEWHNSVLKDSSGRIVGVISSGMDVTDSKRTERDLYSIFNIALDMICIADIRTATFVKVNPSFSRILGYTESELLGSSFMDFIHPDDIGPTKKVLKEKLQKGQKVLTFCNRYRTINGDYRWLEWNSCPVADEGVTYAIAHDVTEARLSKFKLEESEKRFRSTFEQAAVGIAHVSTECKWLLVNQRLCAIVGYTKEEFLNLTFQKITHPDDLAKDLVLMKKLLLGKVNNYSMEKRYVRKDGSLTWINLTVSLVRDRSGKPDYFISVVEEIDKRKRIENKVKVSEARYREIFEGSRDGFVMVSENLKIVDANEAFCKMLGYNMAELRSMKSFYEMTPAKWHSWEQKDIWEEKLKKKSYSGVYEKEFIRKDGTVFPVELQAYAGFDLEGKMRYYWAVARDITETKCLREQSSRAARLEAAGTVAGQVAHDFNNLLGPIVAYPEMIRAELPAGHKCIDYLNDMESSAKKISDINQDLLTLGRRGYYNQEILNLNDILENALRQLRLRSDKVVFSVSKDKDLMSIKGGHAQIYRMLYNLLCNSFDAMREIGQITIKTENYYCDDSTVAFQPIPTGEYVKLTLSDTGQGIPEEIKNRIFDPFFTTKTLGKQRGSGLGLSIVDAVLRDHNAYLDLKSEIGKGTTFYIYFPVCRKAPEKITDKTMEGNEKLMVVDDDAIQRELFKRVLEPLGYKVTLVESGEEALNYLKRDPHDLLILDMIMPQGIDGTETYKRTLEINPSQKAIIVSGFSETSRVRAAQKLGAGIFLRKPLTKKSIATAVRKELGRNQR